MRPRMPCPSTIPQRFRLTAAAAVALGLAACAGMPPGGCADGLHAAVSDRLYLGTATPSGTVAADEWKAFLRDVVTPRFPQGFTVTPASGQWRGTDGTPVREPSYVLVVIHPDDPTGDAAVAAVATAYKARFRQESVLRVRSPACVSF